MMKYIKRSHQTIKYREMLIIKSPNAKLALVEQLY